jgi:hypothetical protein
MTGRLSSTSAVPEVCVLAPIGNGSRAPSRATACRWASLEISRRRCGTEIALFKRSDARYCGERCRKVVARRRRAERLVHQKPLSRRSLRPRLLHHRNRMCDEEAPLTTTTSLGAVDEADAARASPAASSRTALRWSRGSRPVLESLALDGAPVGEQSEFQRRHHEDARYSGRHR